MTFDTWLTFVILELLLCLTPGPAVMFVTTTAAERGARAAIVGTAGILTSNVMYFLISATGVAALLLASPTLFDVLRWGGSLYLLVLGARMIVTRQAVKEGATETVVSRDAGNTSLLHGFLVQTLNPKAIAFFAALLPQFVDPAASVVPQILILTVTSVTVEASVMLFYIWMTVTFGQRAGDQGKLWFRRLGGAFLIVAALRMALSN